MGKNRLKQLLLAYVSGNIPSAELDELLDYVSSHSHEEPLRLLLEEFAEEIAEQSDVEPSIASESLYDRIINHPSFHLESDHQPVRKRIWQVASYAAILILFIGVGLFVYNKQQSFSSKKMDKQLAVRPQAKDISSSKKAILRLSDGRVIDLDNASGGLLATEGNTQITLNGTELQYQGEDILDEKGEILKNTIITPKGRQYQVTLPDGSKMWLNTATTLTYPVRFSSETREVEINGEAYFEVKTAANWPFVVKTKNQQIEVLGTNFNVSAYDDDEATRTTLVTGKVKVSGFDDSKILYPGQRAITTNENRRIQTDYVDTDEVISWTQNLFVFNNEEISEVMKKVSRWYDVEVEYRDGMAGKRIGGTVPRFEHLEELMETLEATNLLHYKMKGGKVIIMK